MQEPSIGHALYADSLVLKPGSAEASLFVFSPDERFVYILGIQTQSLLVFNYDSVTEKLSYLDMYEEGVDGVRGLIGARALELSKDGAYIYVIGRKDEVRLVFERDTERGTLEPAWSVLDHARSDEPALRPHPATNRSLEVARRLKREPLFARQVTEFRPRRYLT